MLFAPGLTGWMDPHGPQDEDDDADGDIKRAVIIQQQ